jgi:riboflavin biosynthesis pyrimidine reductase
VRQIFPVAGQDLAVAPAVTAGPLPAAVAELARLYGNVAAASPAGPERQWSLRANMVASTDGAVSLDGRSGGLSGPADRMVFAVLRSLADVVLVGSGTARAEHYRPVAATSLWTALRPPGAPPPPVAVVTERLGTDGWEQLLTLPPGPSQTIVITTTSAAERRKAAAGPGARIIEAGDDQVDLTAALRALAGLGYHAILAEGGPTLLGQLTGADLLDELCLTTSPVLAAGTAGRIVSAPPHGPATAASRLTLAHVLADESFLFSRYLRAGTVPPAAGKE